MLSDTAASHGNALKELLQLVKLGLLLRDAVVSRRKTPMQLSRLVKLGLLPSDTAVSQRSVFDSLVEWTTKGAVLPEKKNQRQFDSWMVFFFEHGFTN